ncbi:hypothetical protein WICPIJ_003322 [Wickerhamomyces pijperi]|uniref:Peptidase A1 domain-containing protein n=1 Tax=Wickerhamomyces pijperi TaxID=599730 RepID=A0A9P8Q9X3_WICPI|nr:hypothetical protein WICPIJ_003322 [Wickerhamomyces pijperi]
MLQDKRLITTLFALLPHFIESEAKGLGYYRLPFNVTSGVDYEDSLNKRNDEVVNFDLAQQSSFYSVDLVIGSQQQQVQVLLDTGSSDLWVMGSDNSYCSSSTNSKFRVINDDQFYSGFKEGSSKYRVINDEEAFESFKKTQHDILDKRTLVDCSEYGTFDSSSSSSFKSLGTEFYIKYGDSAFASGVWGTDSLTVNGLSVDGLQFAVASQANATVGVLGIGLEQLETTYSGTLATGSNRYTYSNLPSKLVENGLIHRNVYSLYLNPGGSSGSVLFGGVDHAKYSGNLQIVDLVNTLSSEGYTNPVQFDISITGLDVAGTQIFSSGGYTGLLDSGTTYSYFPSGLVATIASAAGATLDSASGYYIMDCDASDKYFVFQFGSASVEVPFSNLLQSVSGAPECILTVLPRSSEEFILGSTFLMSAYVVYDLDNYQVALGQAISTSDSDIEAVVNSIPTSSGSSSDNQDFDDSNTTTTSDTGTTSPTTTSTEPTTAPEDTTTTEAAPSTSEADAATTTTTSQETTSTSATDNCASTNNTSLAVLAAQLNTSSTSSTTSTTSRTSSDQVSTTATSLSSSSSSSSSTSPVYKASSTTTLSMTSSSTSSYSSSPSSNFQSSKTSSDSSSWTTKTISSSASSSDDKDSAMKLTGDSWVQYAVAIGLMLL